MIDRTTLQECVVVIAHAYEEAEMRRGIANKAKRLEEGVLEVIKIYEQAKSDRDDVWTQEELDAARKEGEELSKKISRS